MKTYQYALIVATAIAAALSAAPALAKSGNDAYVDGTKYEFSTDRTPL